MSEYGIKYIIITNNIKCQFGLDHCDGLVGTIKMDILFAYIGVRMHKGGPHQGWAPPTHGPTM
jgi:hypothetical protein